MDGGTYPGGGVPTQVVVGGEGYLPPTFPGSGGYLPGGSTYPGGGYLPWWGVPTQVGGYLPSGVGGTYPGVGYLPSRVGSTYLDGGVATPPHGKVGTPCPDLGR